MGEYGQKQEWAGWAHVQALLPLRAPATALQAVSVPNAPKEAAVRGTAPEGKPCQRLRKQTACRWCPACLFGWAVLME